MFLFSFHHLLLNIQNYVSVFWCKDTMKRSKNLLFFIDFYIF